ncbi:GntR family transcriptional regulator [Segnochrobactraceae bacterium EtOH-i3]
MLEASGLAVRRPRFGVRVAPMSIVELDHIFACRMPLEALSARDLAESPPTDGSVEALHGVLDQMEAASGTGDPEETFFANAEYSSAFNRLVPNRVLARLIEQLSKPALRYRHLTYMERPQMIPFSLDKNRRVVDAVLGRRPDEAAQLTRELIQASWDLMRSSGVLPPADA